MDKLRLDIPSYDKAIVDFVGQVMRGFIRVDPLLGSINFQVVHHNGPTRNVREPKVLDQIFQPIESFAVLNKDAIRELQVDDFAGFVYELAKKNIEGLHHSMFGSISEVAEATGNVGNANGQPLSYDHITDMLEKVFLYFDDKGQPIFPTLVLNPAIAEALKNLKVTDEQLRHRDEVLARKKVEFDAQKRTRRLS